MASTISMPFLRPLPLPRLTSMHRLTRQISSHPCLRTQAASATLHSSTPSPPSPPPPGKTLTQTQTQTQTQAQPQLPPLPYHVHRTASQKLPIYHLAKRGGNLHQTRVRKIEGDVERLRDEIREALELKAEHVVINRLTGHIIVKGWYREHIKRFLEDRHF